GSYNYLWSNSETLSSISNLVAGSYSVSVTDSLGCNAFEVIAIGQPTAINIIGNVTDIPCNGGLDGSVDVSVSGGSGSYSYSWSNGVLTQDISAIGTGTYTLTVSDFNGCTNSSSFNVNQPSPISISATVNSINCFGNADGVINLTSNGGTGTLNYLWSDASINEDLSGVVAGVYSLTITDANGCTKDTSIQITQNPAIIISGVVSDATCNGLSDGSIQASANGGSGIYNFTWDNSIVSQNLVGVAANIYSLVVKDNLGCEVSQIFTVNEPSVISIISTVGDVTCFGLNNGQINITSIGGVGNYSYLWNNASSDSLLQNIIAGNYAVVATDGNGCTAAESYTVNQPSQLILSDVINAVQCNGGSDGSIDLTVTGGNPSYLYLWSNGSTTQDISGFTAGVYIVTVTDASNCSASSNYTITQPSLLTVSLNGVNPSCGAANGSISATVSGGTSGYSYLWSDLSNASSISNIAAGVYTLTINDANGCTAVQSSSLVNQNGPSITSGITTDPSCNGGSNGSIDITISGGTSPFTYSWSNAQTSQDVTGLTAGSYTVTVTDANNCTASSSYSLTQPSLLTVSLNGVNPTCEASNGSISATVSGGTSGYNYLWSNASTASSINNVAAGVYTLTITDANGCTVIQSASLVNQNGPSITSSIISDPLCNGGSDGSIDITISGGVGPFLYSWSNGQTNQDASGLSAGTYTVTITDANSCVNSNSYTINQPSALVANVNTIATTCNLNNGSATASVSGGTGAFTYLWNNATISSSISNVAAGNYTVTITDVNGCSIIRSATVSATLPPVVVQSALTNVLCNGDSTGSISITINNGTAPFTFVWSSGATTQNITDIKSGTYTVTVTDANGCTAINSFNVSQSTFLSLANFSSVNTTCGQANGSAQIIPSGGVAPYTYLWSNGDITNQISNIGAGSYSVTVTDNNGCTRRRNFIITNTNGPAVTLTSQTNVNCFGEATGSINISATDGLAPYTYLWSNSATSQNLSGLSAGDYTITVTDANSCTASVVYTITQLPALTINATIINAGCVASSGSISTAVSGGTIPYTYSWSNGNTTSSISSLSAGSYSLTVTDNNGCISLWSGAVSGAGAPSANFTVSDVTCFGFTDGSISSSTIGGNPPYSYLWSNGSTGSDVNNLSAGSYSVTITDQSGCTSFYTQTVQSPLPLNITASITNVNCFNGTTGSIQLIVTGGTSPYSYLWNNSSTSNPITNLSDGTYNVTLTDDLGCTINRTYVVSENTAIQRATWVVIDNNCYGGTIGAINQSFTGGSGGYTYLWSNGATTEDLANLAAGTYTITVTDNLGCSNSFTYTVAEPVAIVASITSTNASCSLANGSASVSASGGTGQLSYLWSNSQTTSSITNLLAGSYSVTVTDANGCTVSRNVTLTNQVGPSIISGIITDPLCNGGSNGSINISVSGGTVLLNYAWSSGQTTQDINGLIAGNYTVTITDANNCSTTGSYVVNQPSAITASFTSTPSTCNQNNGSLVVTPSGGTPGYSYVWNGGSTSSTINNLAAGIYTVTITDLHACTLVQNSTVLSQPSPVVVQNTLTNVLCSGDSTGAITISINSGTLPFNFLWSNGATSQNISNLTNGTYSVTVTDANGCTGTKSFFISQPAFLSLANYTVVNSTCGQANGSAQVTPVGGVSPYAYLWSNGSIANQILNVPAGTYSVTVTDANGCIRQKNIIVQNTTGPVLTLSNQTNVGCYGSNNGALDILVNSGVSPYTYLWSNGATTQDISNVGAGDYTVTITDANGCIASQQFTISQNDSIAIQGTIVNANCGQSSGSIIVNVSGGTAPYSYNWSSGGTNSSINNLIAGTYTVTITDALLCAKQSTFVVADIPGPSIVLDAIVNATCYNQAIGSIQISITNGTAPFIYQWSNGITSQDNLNVIAGNYTLTVTDDNGCSIVENYTVLQPAKIQATFNVTNANCNLSNGSATVTASGGVGGYTYLWSNGVNGNTISNQSLGNYSVIITDANNCAVVDSVNIFNSGQAAVNLVTQINPICNGSANGQITVTVQGGLGPYQLQWSNGETAYSNTNLVAGNYILTVTDITGCSSQTSYSLIEPDPIAIAFVVTEEHCAQGDGSINATISGGNGQYTYLWSNSSSNSLLTGLTNGNYSLTVTDILGCSATGSQAVNNIPSPIVSQTQVTDAICFNSATGVIDISVQGGVSPYTYLWSNNEITQDVVNVSAGSYSVTVTDNFGCTVRRSFVVAQPDSIVISAMIDNAGCSNNNGEIMIAVSGGVGPYSYNWSNGLTNDTIQNLYAGVYSVIVSDGNNCNAQQTFAVNNISSTNVIRDSIVNVSCNNQSNGCIYLSIDQGEPPYTYEWSTGATTLNLTNQPAGQYVLTVTDNNGCISIYIDTITQPDPFQLLSFVNNPKCNISNGDITVIPSGGTQPYSYLWNTGQTSSTIAGLNTGTYTLTVTDIFGCSTSYTDSVVNSGSPAINLLQLDSVSCNGLSDGSINVDISGGIAPYFYQWVGTTQITEDLSNIPAGIYSLIVTDDVGCTISQSYTVSQPNQIQVNLLAVQNASCGSNNGSAVVTAQGGSGNFNYYWSNASNNDTLSNVGAGSYTLVAVDGSGCSSSIIVNVSNINGPVIAAVDSGNVTCPNVNDGFINITVTGGTLPYRFAWSNLSDTTTNVVNLTGGSYTLTVTDALNCIAVRTVTIEKPLPISINGFTPGLNSPYNLSCYRSEDGSIILNVAGGTSPYNFVWSNGSVSQNISSLQAGTYTVYLTDNNGCTKDSTFFITEPPQLLANAGTDFNVCGQTQANLNASIPIYGIGGWVLSAGPSAVSFTDSTSNTSLISNLSFGDYQLQWIVSDGVCSDSDMVLVNVSTEIVAQAGSDKTLCGNQINLNGTRPQFGYGYWSDSSSAIIADTADPFTLVSNLNYGVNIFNWIVVNGTCRDTGTVKVFVRDSIDCLDPVLLPNAFTPNNDGYNDFFEIKGIQDFLDNEITIFNRWGLVVYNTENYFNTWDGRDNNGNMLSDGTYFAVLKLRTINKFYKTYIDLRR
ncbi:MAG: gliding motility-associated C-terminal domain-containing protein, partial [Bacteroidota bacterium]